MTNMVIEASSSAEGRFLTQMLRAVCRVMVRYSTESIQHPRKRIIVREGRMVDFVLIGKIIRKKGAPSLRNWVGIFPLDTVPRMFSIRYEVLYI